jgi:hypothetical protein
MLFKKSKKNLNDELMKYNLHNQTNIIFNIKKSNLNLEAWWPPGLKQDEKKL